MKANIPDSFFQKLGKSAEVEAAVTRIAGQVVVSARASAPVDSGDYRGAFEVEVARGKGRTVARAVNTDPGALAIEARHGTLQRAGRSVTK